VAAGQPGGQRTYGVAIGIPDPHGAELADWRKRLGDPNAAAIPPHVTLLPPTRLPLGTLPAAADHLCDVAEAHRPFDIRLRGSGTFRPVSPVVFVSLAEGISDCERLERAVRSGPLARATRFNYHPHVTVGHDLPDDALDAAFDALATFEARFHVDAFTLFEQGLDDVWRPLRDFRLGRRDALTSP
jgi:2'-5' RNA ligase